MKKIAVVGAGIYGCSVAIELAKAGHNVFLYDSIGLLRCASSINQFRIHAGYHYPRSIETIKEVQEARIEFESAYGEAIVSGVNTYYAIPHVGSKTSSCRYEEVMSTYNLPCKKVSLKWMNYEFIETSYAVSESLYDPEILRRILYEKLLSTRVHFEVRKFNDSMHGEFDFIVYATYGGSGSHHALFEKVQTQVAEKVLIKLPSDLRKISLVIVDGPFTAFDSYGNTDYSLFGSGGLTNHWRSSNSLHSIPNVYADKLHLNRFVKYSKLTRFEKMKNDASLAVPACRDARYIGSKFVVRVIEYNPKEDRRILKIKRNGNVFHVFSGKVVSALKAARIVSRKLDKE